MWLDKNINKRKYRLPFYFMTIGFIITIISFIDGFTLFNNAINEEEDIKKYSYINTVDVTINADEEIDFNNEIVPLFDEINSNVIISDFITVIDGEDSLHKCNVIINLVEPDNFKMISGSLPYNHNNSLNNDDLEVAIGKYYKKYVYEINQKQYININKKRFYVTGIIGTDNSDIQDYEIVLGKSILNDDLWESGQKWNIVTVSLGSNKSDVNKIAVDLVNKLNNLENISAVIRDKEIEYIDNKKTFDLMYVAIYVFCIINLIVISELWVYSIISEVAIRKAYGFNEGQIKLIVFKELLRISLLSFVMAIIIHLIAGLYLSEVLIVDVRYNLIFFIVVFVSILILDCFLTMVIAHKLKKDSLNHLINNKE